MFWARLFGIARSSFFHFAAKRIVGVNMIHTFHMKLITLTRGSVIQKRNYRINAQNEAIMSRLLVFLIISTILMGEQEYKLQE